MKMILTSDSPETTRLVGESLGAMIAGTPSVVLLRGDLGAGKTTLTKALVAGMGIEAMVTSPTFTLINQYEGGDARAYHLDLYRLADLDELLETGFEDVLDEGVPVIIEWPEMLSDYPLERVLDIAFEYTGTEGQRRLTIETGDPALMKGLEELG